MKKNHFSRAMFVPGLLLLAFLQQGCNLKWTVVKDPYPNFHMIDRRCQFEDQQIGNAAQNGQLIPPVAQALSDNVSLVRQMAWQDQNPEGGQTMDLTAPQTRYLGVLLNDNQMAINDAQTRSSQWADAFQGGWNYDFSYRPDRLLFIANLHHQLVQQEAMVEDGANNGSLNPSQVADLRSRIQVVREAEWDDYNQNGSLDLNRDQMSELSEMVDDNFRYIRFRSQFAGRRWSGDHFDSWGQYKKDFAVTSSSLPSASTSQNRYWDGRNRPNTSNKVTTTSPSNLPNPSNSGIYKWAFPTATPVPVIVRPAAPTPTPWVHPAQPTPVPVQTQHSDHGNDQGDNGRHLGAGHGDNGVGNQGQPGNGGNGNPGQGNPNPKTDTASNVAPNDTKPAAPKPTLAPKPALSTPTPSKKTQEDADHHPGQDKGRGPHGNHHGGQDQGDQQNGNDQKTQDDQGGSNPNSDQDTSNDDHSDHGNHKNRGHHPGDDSGDQGQ